MTAYQAAPAARNTDKPGSKKMPAADSPAEPDRKPDNPALTQTIGGTVQGTVPPICRHVANILSHKYLSVLR